MVDDDASNDCMGDDCVAGVMKLVIDDDDSRPNLPPSILGLRPSAAEFVPTFGVPKAANAQVESGYSTSNPIVPSPDLAPMYYNSDQHAPPGIESNVYSVMEPCVSVFLVLVR